MCFPITSWHLHIVLYTIMHTLCCHFFLQKFDSIFFVQSYACQTPLVLFNAVIQNLLEHCISCVFKYDVFIQE